MVDDHKFSLKRYVVFRKIEDFDILITDKNINPDIYYSLEKNKINFILV